MRTTRLGLIVVAVLVVPCAAIACMWDYDTIKMERNRFPTTLELITGKFLRHSPEFYQWRIADRLKKLEADPRNAAYHDDLAVAYDKTGQHQKAIDTMLKLETMYPGRYETASNLATFYFHAGRIADSVPLLDKALAINPEAHFGREKYQKYLTEYVLSRKRGDALTLPLGTRRSGDASTLDVAWFTPRLWGKNEYSLEETQAAVKGVLGMMRFANHASPILLEALGDLLSRSDPSPRHDAKLLAARAYLKASYEVSDGPSRVAYRAKASEVLSMQTRGPDSDTQVSLEQVETQFQKELAEADKWYAELRENELSWIRDGKDPEAEFDKLYDREPEVLGADPQHRLPRSSRLLIVAAAVASGLAVLFLGYIGYRRVRRGAAQRTPPDGVTPPPS